MIFRIVTTTLLGAISLALLPTSAVAAETLPPDLQWETNDTDPVFSSPEAVRGGTYTMSLTSFPLTLRTVGPDSNGGFASVARNLNWEGLVGEHPNTLNLMPALATHWAFGKDGKSMFFKINPKAKWSDGKPLTADDFIYTLEFMRSKFISAPWYNDYYNKYIEKVVKYDDHTLACFATKAYPDLWMNCSLSPTPKHFYDGKLDKNFVKNFNWKIIPNLGPYDITEVNKGKSIIIKRKKNWWADDERYTKNRYNVEKIVVRVVRDINTGWLRFLKGELDDYGMILPDYWHDKAKTAEFEKGYINKLWTYNDNPRGSQGLWMNMSKSPLDDLNVRLAVHHAVNFDRMNETVLRGDYERLHTFYEGAGEYTNTELRAREFSCDKVGEYLTKSGWKRASDGIWAKDNKALSLTILYTSEAHTQRIVVVREEAKKCGIDLKLQLQSGEQGFKAMLEKQHEIAWLGLTSSIRPSPWQTMHSANASAQSNNFCMVKNDDLDKLIETYDNSINDKERQVLARKIQTLWHDIAAWVPLYKVPYVREGYWRWIRYPNPPATRRSEGATDPFGGSTGGLFWIDQKIKEETLKALKAGMKETYKPVLTIDKTYKVN